MKTDIEVIDEAIELVQRDGGWAQGAYCQDVEGHALYARLEGWFRAGDWVAHDTVPYSGFVSFCLEGALRLSSATRHNRAHATGHDIVMENEQTKRLEALVLAVGVDKRVYGDLEALCEFNDDERTTQEDAILALKKARSVLSERLDGGTV